MKHLIALAFLAACGDDPIHDVVTCGAWPSMPEIEGKQCERGCDLQPSNWEATGEDMPCTASHPDRNDTTCERTFLADGVRGCCAQPVSPDSSVKYEFYSCK